MSKTALGLLIRNLRKAKGLSLRKLAKQVDVSFVNIAHIENGRVATSEEVMLYAVKILNVKEPKRINVKDIQSEMLKNFYKDSKKVSNEKMKKFFDYNLKLTIKYLL